MNHFDTAWKYLVETHYVEFLEFYFPEVASLVDVRGDIQFLELDTGKAMPKGDDPFRYANILAEAPRKRAQKHYGYSRDVELIHIIIQGRGEAGFTERLFQLTCHIYERSRTLPISLVVSTDDDPDFYPNAFEIIDAQRYLRLEYNVAKLLYFRGRVYDPDCYHNPFAFATYVQLEVNGLKRRNEEDKNIQLKKNLLLGLYSYPCSTRFKSSLLLFLNWALPLSDIQEKQMQEVLSRKIWRWYHSLRRNV